MIPTRSGNTMNTNGKGTVYPTQGFDRRHENHTEGGEKDATEARA